MRIIECDRCHKRFNKDAKKTGYVNLDQRDIKTGELDGNREFDDWDICPDCMEKIREFVRKVPPKAEKPEGEKPKATIKKMPVQGKKKEAISRLFDLSHEVWQECAKDHDHSMIQMCEEITGIEITNGDGKGWRDVHYLNGTIPESMTEAQILYMRQQQLKWIRPQIMACMLISMHRKYKFGFERCSRIYQQINDIEAEYRSNPERLRKACYELTGIDVAETVTTDRRESA